MVRYGNGRRFSECRVGRNEHPEICSPVSKDEAKVTGPWGSRITQLGYAAIIFQKSLKLNRFYFSAHGGHGAAIDLAAAFRHCPDHENGNAPPRHL